MKRALFAAFAIAGAASCAPAQSINIDFGSESTAPADAYAAAGDAGHWNVVAVVPAGPILLDGLDGTPSGAWVMIDFGGVAIERDDPGTSGEDELLLDDFLTGTGDLVRFVRFGALQMGLYRVITYGWTPADPQDTTAVWIDGHAGPYQLCGGAWTGGLQLGVTHTVHHANVVDGALVLGVAGGHLGASGNLNAIQLVRLGEPCPADWNHDGVLNSQDLFDFLAAFFAGFADFNNDGATDSRDFFDFLPPFFAGC